MKYSLRSLMIVVLVGPPVLAGCYGVLRSLTEDELSGLFCLTVFVMSVVVPSVIWVLIPIRQ